MRNAFVLVSLCIGLASGFIVPSGGLELMGEDRAILAENNGKESEETKRATLQDDGETGFVVLPFRKDSINKLGLENIGKRIKDTDLYDQHSPKQNNVNERSFIYINQKYKSPILSQLYSNTRDLLKETYKSVLTNLEDARKYPVYLKTNKEYFTPNKKPPETTKALFFQPANYGDQNKKEYNMNQEGNRIDEQHEYVELLKPPLLRPSSKMENILENDLKWPYSGTSNTNYKPLKNIHNIKTDVPLSAKQFSVGYYDNYGFPTPYGYQRSVPQYKPEELRLASDSKVRQLLENENNSADTSKLIDRHLKESMKTQVTNERIKTKNCSYTECILKSRKQYINSRVNSHPECKCGRKLNLKRIPNEDLNDSEEVDTTDKGTLRTTEAVHGSRSSEMNDYSDMLAEEMNLKKLIEE